MVNNKIVIGISPRCVENEIQMFIRVGMQYINQLQDESIIPLILVNSPNLELELSLCDGILLIGGDDIDPTYYGQTNDLGFSKGINKIIDETDYQILNHALKYNKPVLGICRGIQVFGAFMNGTLHQDLAYNNVLHPEHDKLHDVIKVNNFGVAKLLPNKFLVNTFHHQAIDVVPEGFIVLYKNKDTIEAIEHTSKPLIGVQWHPERYYTEESKIIFNYFFEKVRNYENKNN